MVTLRRATVGQHLGILPDASPATEHGPPCVLHGFQMPSRITRWSYDQRSSGYPRPWRCVAVVRDCGRDEQPTESAMVGRVLGDKLSWFGPAWSLASPLLHRWLSIIRGYAIRVFADGSASGGIRQGPSLLVLHVTSYGLCRRRTAYGIEKCLRGGCQGVV